MSKVENLVFETAGDTYIYKALRGEGRNGRVYEVVDSQSQSWALKCLKPDEATPTRTKRFLNELAFCQKGTHPNVVTVFDHGFITLDGKKCPFYVMRLYPSTLRHLIKSSIPPDAALRYFSQMLDGVEAAHFHRVWHRDLKPENILYDPDSKTLVVSDFGVAHFAEEVMYTTVETQPGERLANFQYSAPEQRARSTTPDQRADIFALGLILSEMFTGDVPQGTGFKKIGQVAPDHAYLDEIVDVMVRQSPADRPGSIDLVKQILIGKQNEFISRQKLDALRNTVVPSGTVVDAIVDDPVKAVGFDVKGRTLIITLNHNVPPEWVHAFHSIGSYTSLQGSAPPQWQLSGRDASVVLGPYMTEKDVQAIVNNFKNYLGQANSGYRDMLERRARQEEEEKKKALQLQIEQEEKRQRILRGVKL